MPWPRSAHETLKRSQIFQKRVKEAQSRGMLGFTFDEQINFIIKELGVLSREEWLEIAFVSGQGGAGFGPMRQLQLKIRHNPLTFLPRLMGLFKTPTGEPFEREVAWPEFKRKAKEWRAYEAYGAHLDFFPYLTIDPVMDLWDRMEEEVGPNHPATIRVMRKVLRLCLADYERDFFRPPKAAIHRSKSKGGTRPKDVRRRRRVRPQYLPTKH